MAVPRGDAVVGRADDFGPWTTLWKHHDRWSSDGTWDRLLTDVCADADAVAELDWLVAVDPSINRAHQHAAGARRITNPTQTDTADTDTDTESVDSQSWSPSKTSRPPRDTATPC
jgi:transposase